MTATSHSAPLLLPHPILSSGADSRSGSHSSHSIPSYVDWVTALGAIVVLLVGICIGTSTFLLIRAKLKERRARLPVRIGSQISLETTASNQSVALQDVPLLGRVEEEEEVEDSSNDSDADPGMNNTGGE